MVVIKITAEPTKRKRNMSDSRATDIATPARYSAYVLFKENITCYSFCNKAGYKKDCTSPHVMYT